MKKINFSSDVLPHALAVIVFLVVTVLFFNPIFFGNKSLSQGDIQQHLASSKALRDFRSATGEEGLWVGTMFSGMPAYLVNLEWSDDVLVAMKKVLGLFLPHPVRNIYLAFLSFYILLLSFRVRPYLSIAGALAFGLSSYLIIGLAAGHNARIGAIAFMPMVIAGIHLAFTGKRALGFGLTAGGLALHLRESHLQITYYLVLVVVVYGLIQLVTAVREKQLGEFFKSLAILIPAVILAAATFFGQFLAVTEYSIYSIRGPSELGTQPVGDGLTKEYAFSYNYGILEPVTLLIPEFYGGTSGKYFVQDENSASYKALTASGDNQLANQLVNFTSAYWGPQRLGTAGPYYAGAITIFLFAIGILFADKKYVLWLVPLSVLSIVLSWGDSFPSFNYFIFDNLPGYNKFRSVNFSLIIILLAMPLLGMIGLERLLSEQVFSKKAKTKLLIAAASTGGLCLLIFALSGMASFTREGESSLPVWFLNALRDDRKALLKGDALRSLAFIFSIFILLYLNVPKRISAVGFYAFLALMITIDLAVVDKRYFTKDYFQRKRDNSAFEATPANQEVLKDKTYYRVFNIQEAFSLDGRTSYHHHSLGGYHGAKIRRYQDLYDSCISKERRELMRDAQTGQIDFRKYGVLNMLNTKYILYGPDRTNIIQNPEANGSAWYVHEVVVVKSPTEELSKIKEVNLKETAVIDESKFKVPVGPWTVDSVASIVLAEQKPYWQKYESSSGFNALAVFSEIYYPKGWHAFVDGKEAPILRVDYVLRALEVPAGKHTIEFRFEPKPYTIGDKVTMASSWVLLLVVLGSLGWSLRMNNEQ